MLTLPVHNVLPAGPQGLQRRLDGIVREFGYQGTPDPGEAVPRPRRRDLLAALRSGAATPPARLGNSRAST